MSHSCRLCAASFAAVAVTLTLVLALAIAALPPPLQKVKQDSAKVVLAADGSVLRTFPNSDGVRRFPVAIDEIDPRYLEVLLAYEDQYFYHHPGVNPVALARALLQRLRFGRWISGGSTLTMQVARILDPHPRNVSGKLRQIFRALQLEFHLSKREILEIYLNYAPFGGNIEGVEAAARRYLGKSARTLSRAEAALLAVLPQAPSRFRPDRHPAVALKARDKVLHRLASSGRWPLDVVGIALDERLQPRVLPDPMIAPLLARRLAKEHGEVRIQTFIDAELQRRLQYAVRRHIERLDPATSAAAIIVDNASLQVEAYVGTARYGDVSSQGFIDMGRALRSPGSLMKPFIYGQAISDGLIHSASPLFDTPRDFNGYRPQNFRGDFVGVVPADEALRRSLNVPAVDLLNRIGPDRWLAGLRHAGVNLRAEPGLPLALGGFGISLEEVVMMYAALDRGGQHEPLRYARSASAGRVSPRLLLDPGAAWIVLEMLKAPSNSLSAFETLAVKTGTSYGHRDAWAIAVGNSRTIGVWIGRPDGTSLPGSYGAATAVPLLRVITGMQDWKFVASPVPARVREAALCWPLPDDCRFQRTALTLDGLIPPVQAPTYRGAPAFSRQAIRVNAQGLQLTPGCLPGVGKPDTAIRWASWLGHVAREMKTTAPQRDPRCRESTAPLVINGLNPESDIVIRNDRTPIVSLTLTPAVEATWLVNGAPRPVASAIAFTPEIGANTVVALANGQRASIDFQVREHAP